MHIQTPSFKLAVYQRGNPSASKLALVLPALLDTKDYPHLRNHVGFLADHGFLALSFDPPGTWGSGGDINNYTITNYLQAVTELIEYFGNKPTAIVGHSMGGRIALLAANTNPHVTAVAAIMFSATPVRITNAADQFAAWKKEGIATTYRDMPSGLDRVRFDIPYSFSEDANDYTPMLDDALQTPIPKLFIIGTRDTAITPEEAKETYGHAAMPKTLKSVDSGHNYRRQPEVVDEINREMWKLLTSYEGKE